MSNKLKNFKKEMETTVTVKIVSSSGHDEYEDTAVMALDRIASECNDNGKWAYINGTQVTPGEITISDILEAEDITLTNALVGGQ
ncbi:MAG: hypothetical protein H8E12_17030 [Rhodobacteraceae bacterium]|nr:hypothetical protein [Paracoccaceae bacterium]